MPVAVVPSVGAVGRDQNGQLEVPDSQGEPGRAPAVEVALAEHVVVSVVPLVGNEVGDRGVVLADLQGGVVRELPHAVGAPDGRVAVPAVAAVAAGETEFDLAGDLVGLDLDAQAGVALEDTIWVP